MAPIEAARAMIALSFFCSGVSSFRGEQSSGTSKFVSDFSLFNSPFNSSSTEISNASARTGKLNISGQPDPDSHFEIVLFERFNLSANCCCVKPCFFLNSAINLPVCTLSILYSTLNSSVCLLPYDHMKLNYPRTGTTDKLLCLLTVL